jgi:hypothetical protein
MTYTYHDVSYTPCCILFLPSAFLCSRILIWCVRKAVSCIEADLRVSTGECTLQSLTTARTALVELDEASLLATRQQKLYDWQRFGCMLCSAAAAALALSQNGVARVPGYVYKQHWQRTKYKQGSIYLQWCARVKRQPACSIWHVVYMHMWHM